MSVSLEALEAEARSIGRIIWGAIPDGTGFAVLLFDFGDGGNLTYISNGKRADLIKTLRECAEKLEHGAEYAPKGGRQ
jgi:hypothetical protein